MEYGPESMGLWIHMEVEREVALGKLIKIVSQQLTDQKQVLLHRSADSEERGIWSIWIGSARLKLASWGWCEYKRNVQLVRERGAAGDMGVETMFC